LHVHKGGGTKEDEKVDEEDGPEHGDVEEAEKGARKADEEGLDRVQPAKEPFSEAVQ